MTQNLRDRCNRANYNDTVVLNFGKGTFTISGTIRLQCHTIITGAGRDQTTILLDKGSDRSGFKAFIDDTYFKIYGTSKRPVSVSISDVTFRLKEHKGIWWPDEIRHAVKIYHANRVDIHDADSYMDNAVITNYDLRVCSNVTVNNCIISNYNNCEGGGCLWIRGEMHNIHVKNNKFYKYGKDETLAIYDRAVDVTDRYVRGKANRTNIIVENNEFHYGDYKGKGNAKNPEATCGMVFSLFTDHKKSTDKCTTRNFHLRGNKFLINDICTRCMYIGFDPADEHKDIYIENNEIIHSQPKQDVPYYYCDIEVHDLSASTDIIHINNNTLKNSHAVVNKYGTTGYAFLVMRGGHDNSIVNNVTKNPSTGKQYGIELVWHKSDGNNSDVSMTGNVCKGLDCIAHVGAWHLAEKFSLSANNNYFAGNTRINCESINKLDLNFSNNTLNSQSETFFLEGFAQKGNVVFNNNVVTVNNGRGQFLTRNNGSSGGRIDNLEIQNNVFNGITSEKDMFKNVTNVGKRKIKSNRISR